MYGSKFCFCATLQEDCYVLLLRLSDLPVKMSCPLMRPPVVNIATATCRHDDIEVNLKGGLHTSEIYVKCKACISSHVPTILKY